MTICKTLRLKITSPSSEIADQPVAVADARIVVVKVTVATAAEDPEGDAEFCAKSPLRNTTRTAAYLIILSTLFKSKKRLLTQQLQQKPRAAQRW